MTTGSLRMVAILLALHAVFLSAFLLRLFGLVRPGHRLGLDTAPATVERYANPHANALLMVHGMGFAVFYWACCPRCRRTAWRLDSFALPCRSPSSCWRSA